MKTALWVFAFSALGLLPVKSSEREIPYFVSTQWLAGHANDSGLVILQKAFTRKEYEVAHIPGTRFLWFRRLAIDTPDLSTEMPDISAAKNILEELGISRNFKIVIVFTKGSVTTTTTEKEETVPKKKLVVPKKIETPKFEKEAEKTRDGC